MQGAPSDYRSGYGFLRLVHRLRLVKVTFSLTGTKQKSTVV